MLTKRVKLNNRVVIGKNKNGKFYFMERKLYKNVNNTNNPED